MNRARPQVSPSSDDEPTPNDKKGLYFANEEALSEEHQLPKAERLHRDLKARHVTMIAIGGALGTGLLIGTGSALARAGPAGILITYSIIGCVVYMVLCALGEMATWLPQPSGFGGYATRFVDPAMGFTVGWCYWLKYIIVTPNQLTAAALVIQYWCPREKVNPGVWIAIFLVVIVCINYFGVRFFGEFEFWLSSLKIIVLVGLIICSLVLAAGGGPDHDAKGFRYWKNPGAFHPYITTGNLGRFYSLISALVTATYAFLGSELIGVTVGEIQNPRRNVPRAIKLTFYRIVFFYIISVFLVGMLVPYNSPKLLAANKKSTSANASPFVVAIILSGIKGLPSVMNACILIFVFSAANSDLYIASRTIYGLATEGNAPRVFARTDKRGVPIYALGFSACFGCLAFLNVTTSSGTVFTYFTNLVTVFGLLTWISILISHIFFRRARKAQGIPDSVLVYTAPLGIWGSYAALFVCVIVTIFKNYSVFVHSKATGGTYGDFDYKNFITGYLGIPVYFILFFGYKLVKRTKLIKPGMADLMTGKKEIDDEEDEFVEGEKEAHGPGGSKAGKWYKLVSWLF